MWVCFLIWGHEGTPKRRLHRNLNWCQDLLPRLKTVAPSVTTSPLFLLIQCIMTDHTGLNSCFFPVTWECGGVSQCKDPCLSNLTLCKYCKSFSRPHQIRDHPPPLASSGLRHPQPSLGEGVCIDPSVWPAVYGQAGETWTYAESLICLSHPTTSLTCSGSPRAGELKESFFTRVEVTVYVGNCVGGLGRWFPNVCGTVMAELWERSRWFEWWMACGRLDCLRAAGSHRGLWSRRSWLMRSLLPSYLLSLLFSIASSLISSSALSGQSRTVGGLLLTVLEVKTRSRTHAWIRALDSQPTWAKTF